MSSYYSQIQEIKSENIEANANFGSSCSVSGSVMVIGAYMEDAKGTDSGAAYIYKKHNDGTWGFFQKILGSDLNDNISGGSSSKFGYSCAISGNTIVVGAYLHDVTSGTANEQQGRVYIFEKNSDGTWGNSTSENYYTETYKR